MSSAKRSDPGPWEKIRNQFMESGRGREPEEWSARKAQFAVQEYKRRGGRYASDGPDQEDTDLAEWTREDWGTRSGRDSSDQGERYLRRAVRVLLTESEYRRSTKKKQSDSYEGDEQFSDQPDDVREKAATFRNTGPTKAILQSGLAIST